MDSLDPTELNATELTAAEDERLRSECVIVRSALEGHMAKAAVEKCGVVVTPAVRNWLVDAGAIPRGTFKDQRPVQDEQSPPATEFEKGMCQRVEETREQFGHAEDEPGGE